MAVDRYDIVITRENENAELTLEALAMRAGVHPTLVQRFVELDLLQPTRASADLRFDSSMLVRLRMIGRLRRTLGVNCAGVAIILDLLERMSALRRENEWLRAREHGGSEIDGN
jgi:DNA-binding transcriptional MerR regulator